MMASVASVNDSVWKKTWGAESIGPSSRPRDGPECFVRCFEKTTDADVVTFYVFPRRQSYAFWIMREF